MLIITQWGKLIQFCCLIISKNFDFERVHVYNLSLRKSEHTRSRMLLKKLTQCIKNFSSLKLNIRNNLQEKEALIAAKLFIARLSCHAHECLWRQLRTKWKIRIIECCYKWFQNASDLRLKVDECVVTPHFSTWRNLLKKSIEKR